MNANKTPHVMLNAAEAAHEHTLFKRKKLRLYLCAGLVYVLGVCFCVFGIQWFGLRGGVAMFSALFTCIVVLVPCGLLFNKVDAADPHLRLLDDDELIGLRVYCDALPEVRAWLDRGIVDGCVPRLRDLCAAIRADNEPSNAPQVDDLEAYRRHARYMLYGPKELLPVLPPVSLQRKDA